jgi:hypothetical protein
MHHEPLPEAWRGIQACRPTNGTMPSCPPQKISRAPMNHEPEASAYMPQPTSMLMGLARLAPQTCECA